MKTFSITEAIKSGWATFKLNKKVLILSSLIFLILVIIQSYQKKDLFSFNSQLLIWAVIFLIGIVIQSGYFKILLKISNGQPATFSEMFSHLNLFWKYLGLSILMVIVSLLPSMLAITIIPVFIFIPLPTVALVVLGIALFVFVIWMGLYIGLRLPFSFIILVDKEIGPIAAIKESARITKGMKWDVFCLFFALGFIQLIGIIALGVGVLVSFPVSMLAMIHVYRKLSGSSEIAI